MFVVGLVCFMDNVFWLHYSIKSIELSMGGWSPNKYRCRDKLSPLLHKQIKSR